MSLSTWMLVFVGLAAVLIPHPADAVAVMSVDLGSEWMKIGIVSPGVPMEIVLNKESKRKTPVTIAFRDGERLFGEDAASLGVRFPKNSYSYLLDLLGKRIDNPVVQLFQQRFPYYEIVADPERHTVVFQHDSETQFSPEHLLAMLLAKAQEFAQEYAQQPVTEAVLTVPGYFNQAERRALLQAAELAGIKVLQLINDYTAVALNYGIFRRKDFNESAQYIMFYDMGASHTTATVVSYQMVKTKEKGFTETNPQVAILGVGYDRTLGGLEVQLRLRDYLAKKFNEMKKTPNDVFKNPRAMAKLLKEAGRVKNVLSANAEHYAQVEGLLDDHDFKLLVTRHELEEMCADLFDRVKGPIDQALKTSSLDMDVISQVILVGAGTRMPKVQERLMKIVGMELGKNLNTDEAAALGAVYKAADLSTGFKVKKFLTKDAVIFPVQVVFEREVEGQASPKQVRRILFGPMNPYPQKKVLTFNKHQNDFTFYVNYAELDHLPPREIQALGPLNITRVDLTGVEEAIRKNTGPNIESKGIKAHFVMDESGLLNLANVELVVEKTLTEEELAAQEESPLSKLGNTISKLFTGGEEKKDDLKEEKQEKASHEEEVKETTEEKTGEEKAEAEKKEKKTEGKMEDEKKSEKEDAKNVTKGASTEKKPKVVVLKEPIVAAEEPQGVPAMSEAQLQEAFKKIQALNEFDREKTRRESALNALESFVFDTQNKLESEEYLAAATEEEVEKIRKMCSEISTWLDEEGFEADADTYEAKLLALKTLTKPLFRRVKEHQERPEMLSHLNMVLNASTHFLASARNMTTEAADGLFTPVELETLEKVLRETEEWKAKMEEEQAAQKLSENPKLTVKAILEKTAQLDREVKYLVNKAKIWKPKKSKEGKDKESSKNDTEEAAETVDEEETPTQEAQEEGAPEQPEVVEAREAPAVEEKEEDIRPGSGESEPELPETVAHMEGQDEEKSSHSEL
ncbi:hypoxia up-regulated protein 1 isoform X2 [Anabrus simplex]|uniref:hypoxia up-regulated protein 1 isoform X2 n=1 Tax=Anabrus simplex TaxID=316456 RepID=UPI0035A2B012